MTARGRKRTDLTTTGQHQLALDPYHRWQTLPNQRGCSFETCRGSAWKGRSRPARAPRGATSEPTVLVQAADREERGEDFRRLDVGVEERVTARWSERGVEAGGCGDQGPGDAALRHGFPQRAKEAMLGPGPQWTPKNEERPRHFAGGAVKWRACPRRGREKKRRRADPTPGGQRRP
ncbi:hypothetical protein THAOC_28017 [Thalassiosira oceanica]|uniref:Uncharacterized protein n=1 Tax=Thalassiosira oceanica TaxID=159749 RepID=K0RV69_THAOC|nr:hypothetical protein THAOC_28017 [Thalassiosira oceanica]|eukprot:EJK52681.1 hypothetical protein THAOC_28017 [Thalassiosira oceanica]